MNEQEEEVDLADLSTDKLLSLFLDALRDLDRDAAFKVADELRYKIGIGSPLPRDVRPDPTEQSELRRFSALWREQKRKQAAGV